MSKHYLPLISLLLIIAFLVGSLAFYRTLTAPTKKPPVIALTTLAPTALPTKEASVAGQIAGSTSAQLILEITSPEKDASVSSSLLPIAGKTATEAGVTVNDKVVLVDSQGEFRTSLRLTSGPNLIVITASESGKSRIWQTVVTYTAKTNLDAKQPN